MNTATLDPRVEDLFWTHWHEKGWNEGIEQGMQQGIEQGIEQGKRREAAKFVARLCRRRFGADLDGAALSRMEPLSARQIEDLGEALFDFAVPAGVDRWLDRQ